jgi:hypothetical protein
VIEDECEFVVRASCTRFESQREDGSRRGELGWHSGERGAQWGIFLLGMTPQTCPCLGENLSIPAPVSRGKDFFPYLNPTGNGAPTEIPVSDITKEFPLIPDPRPEPTIVELGSTGLFYFLLIIYNYICVTH